MNMKKTPNRRNDTSSVLSFSEDAGKLALTVLTPEKFEISRIIIKMDNLKEIFIIFWVLHRTFKFHLS